MRSEGKWRSTLRDAYMPLKPVNIPSSPTSIKLLSTKVCSSVSPIYHPRLFHLFITPSPLITYVEELQEKTSKQIKGLMLLCTKYMEAGSTLYTINRSAAENIWQVSNPLSSSHLFLSSLLLSGLVLLFISFSPLLVK